MSIIIYMHTSSIGDGTLKQTKYNFNYLIITIYVIAFLFFVFKMFFYSQFVTGFPDEIQHISYIAYLEKTNAIIPNFKNMTVLQPINDTSFNIGSMTSAATKFTFSSSFNYLCHPPLYYDIMRLSGGVTIANNIVSVNIFRLRLFNIILSSIAMLIVLYIGYTRIRKNPLLHLLYSAIAISVPMLAFDSAGVNNDTLAFIGVSIFILGLLRLAEKNRTLKTFIVISIGVFLAFLAKLTAGLIVLLAMIIFLIITIIKERNLKFLLSKNFLVTTPVYLVIAAYYIIVRLQTGSILPNFRLLSPQQFYKSTFYVPVVARVHMNFMQYSTYYIGSFLRTWTGIASAVSLLKVGSIFSFGNIALFSLLIIPIFLLFSLKRNNKNMPIIYASISVYFALVISSIVQWLKAYDEYVHISGYLGAYQSRYYLCGISALALAITYVVDNLIYGNNKKNGLFKYKKTLLYSICIIFIALLFYEDFIYFLIHFKDYI